MLKKVLIGLLVLVFGVFVINLVHSISAPMPLPLQLPLPRPQAPAARIVSVDAAPEDISQFPMLKRGVHSVDAVLALIARGWYPDMKGLPLHIVVVAKDFWAYSQYFKNGKMYWTKHPTLVKAGSVLFCTADESKCVNSVCANEISLTPMTPTEIGSPLIPDVPIVLMPDTEETSSISDYSGSPGVPPFEGAPPTSPSGECCFAGGGPGGGSPGSPPTPPIVSTPEPQSFLLLAVGILFLGIVRSL